MFISPYATFPFARLCIFQNKNMSYGFRKTENKGLVVLRVRSIRVDGEAVDPLFLGYGHFNDLDFTVQLLILQAGAVQGSGVYMLHADAPTRACSAVDVACTTIAGVVGGRACTDC